jgi:photosystem II stability/assembly factor-like uncharacterized protein
MDKPSSDVPTEGSWQSAGLATNAIAALATTATQPGTVYAGSTESARLWKTTTSGASWTEQEFGVYPTQIVIDPGTPDTVYATSVHKVHKTLNGGLVWIEVGGGGAAALLGIAIDPLNSRTVLIAAEQGWGIYKSTDGAASFGASLLSNIHASAVAFLPGNSQVLYAGAWDYTPGERGGVWKTSTGGGSWTRVLTSTRVHCLAVSPSGRVFAGTDTDGLQISQDGVAFARATGLPPDSVRSVAIDPRDSMVVYAGTWEGGVFRSTDGGMGTWTPMNKGLANTFVLSLVVDASDPAALFVGTKGSGVFRWYPPR